MSTQQPNSQKSPVAKAVKRGRRLRLKLFFACIVTSVFLLSLEAILTLAGVRPLFYDDPFVGFAAGSPLFQETVSQDGSPIYQTVPSKRDWFNQQSFAAKKPTDTYRIFCLGGSTTVGRPYDDKTSFARWMREFLKAGQPDRKFEVINAGGISYASYRIARLMTELADYEPDLFIVYTGHNEFLESHTYSSMRSIPDGVRSAASFLSHTRIYSAAHRILHPPVTRPKSGTDTSSLLSPEVEAILDQSVGPESYRRDKAAAQNVNRHFRSTLHRLIDIAHNAGAEIIFVEPQANLKSCQPFKSQHKTGLSSHAITTWNQHFQTAKLALSEDRPTEALAACDAALKIDDVYALTHFQRGQALYSLQRFEEAKTAFQRASDEDVCPLRVLTSLKRTLHEVVNERNAPILPFSETVQQHSPHGIAGEEMFLDHVHPTIMGHALIADGIVRMLDKRGIIETSGRWNASVREKIIAEVEATLNHRDHALALRNLGKVLTWAGKYAEADRLVLEAVKDLPEDFDAQFLAGTAHSRAGNFEIAIQHFENTIQLNPNHAKAYNNLGDAYFQTQQFDKALDAFEQAIRCDPQLPNPYSNIGIIHIQNNDLHQAEQFLKMSLQLNPASYETNILLSKVYLAAGFPNESFTHAQAALKIRPNDIAAQELLQQIGR